MDAIDAFRLLKAAYPDLSRQQGRSILRALVQRVGELDRAVTEIARIVPDQAVAEKMIACIRAEFAHKRDIDVGGTPTRSA